MKGCKTNFKVWLAFMAVSALGVVLVFKSASALTISPTRFELSGKPGESVSGEIAIYNEGEWEETLSVSYSNFEAQGESGEPAFVDPKEGLGTWIVTEENRVTIPPQQQKIIPFRIDIPLDAEPGGHFAVIFWGTPPPEGESSAVSLGAKTGILVLLSVEGEVEKSTGLLSFNTKDNKSTYNSLPVSFEYRFKNDGGDRVKPEGRIIIRNTLFWATERLDANPIKGNVLPKSTRKFSVDWVDSPRPVDYVAPDGFFATFFETAKYQWQNFAVGLYSAELDLGEVLTETPPKTRLYFFVFPWQMLICLFVVLFVVIFFGKRFIRRYNELIISQALRNGHEREHEENR